MRLRKLQLTCQCQFVCGAVTMSSLLLLSLLFVCFSKHVVTSPIRRAALDAHDGSNATGTNVNSNPETLEELMSEHDELLEGDMILSLERNAVEHSWPSTNIPYMISSVLKSRTGDILLAMALVSAGTCVTFHSRNNEADYLFFTSGEGCASYVGFMGGEQPVFVAPSCIVGNIAHEILHALGFHHEHTRTDRDQYVTVLPHNILKGKERNFHKRNGQTFNLGYDISSILHYGSNFFSGNGLPTIIPKNINGNMGQRKALTKLDIAKVNSLYECGPGGKEKVNDVTPGQHTGVRNDNATKSVSSGLGAESK